MALMLGLILCISSLAAVRASAPQQFGHALLPLFQLDPSYTNLNHGSYGSVPLSVTQNATAWEKAVEKNPDAFFRYNVWGLMDGVRRLLSAYLGCHWADLVFVPNASAGVNTVLRSLLVPAGKKILYLNTAYGMVKSTINYLEPSSRLQVNLTMPPTKAAILASVAAALSAHPEVYIASFSHIASLPALLLPVAELTALCHAHGVLVMIDGAHALGHVPVNITEIGADFWLGNGHKWLYSPKGSAVLWVRRELQPLVRPLTISWDEGPGATDFQAQFAYQGTASYTPYLAMAAALDFRRGLGTEAEIMGYMHGLAVSGGRLLAQQWGTKVLCAEDALYGAMVDVEVPTANATLAALLPALLLEKYNTWVPVYPLVDFGGLNNTFFVRVSFNVYNELSDAMFLARAVKSILA